MTHKQVIWKKKKKQENRHSSYVNYAVPFHFLLSQSVRKIYILVLVIKNVIITLIDLILLPRRKRFNLSTHCYRHTILHYRTNSNRSLMTVNILVLCSSCVLYASVSDWAALWCTDIVPLTTKKEIGFHFLSNGTKKDVISKLITFKLKQLMIQYFI